MVFFSTSVTIFLFRLEYFYAKTVREVNRLTAAGHMGKFPRLKTKKWAVPSQTWGDEPDELDPDDLEGEKRVLSGYN